MLVTMMATNQGHHFDSRIWPCECPTVQPDCIIPVVMFSSPGIQKRTDCGYWWSVWWRCNSPCVFDQVREEELVEFQELASFFSPHKMACKERVANRSRRVNMTLLSQNRFLYPVSKSIHVQDQGISSIAGLQTWVVSHKASSLIVKALIHWYNLNEHN